MTVHRIGQIEVFEIDQNIDHYTRKEREKVINGHFKKEYQGKEVNYLLNGEEINAAINHITRNNFKARQHSNKYESNKAFKTRNDIVFSGDYMNLISNIPYIYSNDEKKANQNIHHKKDNKWHYFQKVILCNNILFSVNIDIIERKNRFYIYNVKLKEVDAPTIRRSKISTSYETSISKYNADLKDDFTLHKIWIDESILSVILEHFNDSEVRLEAVHKTIKNQTDCYFIDGDQVLPVPIEELDPQLQHILQETIAQELESSQQKDTHLKEREER